MVLLYPSAFVCFIAVLLSCVSSAFVERKLLCSSENFSIWYTYDGPLYYLSVSVSPCSQGVPLYSLTYTVIPMFTVTRIGYHAVVHYKGQLWLEKTQPDVPCEDVKICYIIKGETLHETAPFYVRRFYGPKGEYQVYLTVNIIDDLERTVTLHFNITIQVKNEGSENAFFPKLI